MYTYIHSTIHTHIHVGTGYFSRKYRCKCRYRDQIWHWKLTHILSNGGWAHSSRPAQKWQKPSFLCSWRGGRGASLSETSRVHAGVTQRTTSGQCGRLAIHHFPQFTSRGHDWSRLVQRRIRFGERLLQVWRPPSVSYVRHDYPRWFFYLVLEYRPGLMERRILRGRRFP